MRWEALVEFQTPEQIRRQYPDGVRELADGGTWNTIACQPTDDSEMALLLARMLVDQGRIAETLTSETDKLDALADKIRSSIEMLREHRTALISAAVTGKIDVRGELP